MDETGGRVIATRSKLLIEIARGNQTLYNNGKRRPKEASKRKQNGPDKTEKVQKVKWPRENRKGTKSKLVTTKDKGEKPEGRKGKLNQRRQRLTEAKATVIQSISSTKNKSNKNKRYPKRKNLSTDKRTFNKSQQQTVGYNKPRSVKTQVAVQRKRLSTIQKSAKKVTINRKQQQQGKSPNIETKNKKETKHRRISIGVKTKKSRKTRQKEDQINGLSNEENNELKSHGIGHFDFEEVNSFNVVKPRGLDNPHSICPVSDDKAWVAFNFKDTIYLLNKSGVIEQTLKMPGEADDIALRPDGSLLVTNYSSHNVWSVDKTYQKIKTEKSFEIAPLISRAVNCLGNEIVISYVKMLSLHKTNADDKRIVMKRTSKGKKIQEYTQLADNEEIECPSRLALNVNGDVLVVEQGKGQLILIGKNGKEKCRYPEEQSDNSDIYGVTCNSDGFIFVSDYTRHCIDVLYPDGMYCQTLIGNTGPLNNIKMDTVGDLWIGALRSPHIRVIKIFKRA